jgi:colanic acid/amylovoran biosynthesis glycosyltransferase
MLDEADIFLLPSVTGADGDMEGIPVALMEAMAVGIPVVSTVHSGIPELIESGESGWLVPENDATALADRLQSLGEAEHQTLQPVITKARAKVDADFNQQAINTQLASLLQTL